jgi:zinc-ribbon domain
MAFCNSCGSKLGADEKFCPQCGAAQLGDTSGGTVAAPARPYPATPAQRNTAHKRVLIAAAAALALGVLTLTALIGFALHMAHRTHVDRRDGNVRIESPFGNVESTNDLSEISREIGIDVYPKARLLKGQAADVKIAGMHTVAAEFETDDPADKVADFYKSKLPNADLHVSGGDYSISSTDNHTLLTIKIEPRESKTLIKVATVHGKDIGGSSND